MNEKTEKDPKLKKLLAAPRSKFVPLVKPVRKNGFLMCPVKVDRAAIRAAIRADRDAR